MAMNTTATLRGEGKEAIGQSMFSSRVAVIIARENWVKMHGPLPRVEHWKIEYRGVPLSHEEVENLTKGEDRLWPN